MVENGIIVFGKGVFDTFINMNSRNQKNNGWDNKTLSWFTCKTSKNIAQGANKKRNNKG